MSVRDLFRCTPASLQPAAGSAVGAGFGATLPFASGRLRPSPDRIRLSLAALAALLLCAADAVAVRPGTPLGAAIGYTCESLSLLGCAAAFWLHARSATGLLRIRWTLMVAALLTAALAFAQSSPDIFQLISPLLRPYQVAFFNTSDALYILAIVLFFSGVSRSIVVLDMLQALLFAVLRFSLTYSSTTSSHFSDNHLLISQLVALFLFLVALIAGLGAASLSEHRYLRILSWFFGLRFVGYVFADQVSYVWRHNIYCSLWDVFVTSSLTSFAFYLFYDSTQRSGASEQSTNPRSIKFPVEPRRPSLFVRSLMPSFLALVNLMLGLFALNVSFYLAAFAISLTVILYVARTAMLQGTAATESALLQSRNEQLEGLAARDYLTGIGNRRSFSAMYDRLQASANSSNVALVLVDIDHFKLANDLLGHLYGDQVLTALAKTLETAAAHAPGSHCARLGGDEFALLLTGVSDQQARTIAEEVRCSFAARTFQTGEVSITLSLGMHWIDSVRKLPLETLIFYADAALYRAKTLGRNRVDSHATDQTRPFDPSASRGFIELQPANCARLQISPVLSKSIH